MQVSDDVRMAMDMLRAEFDDRRSRGADSYRLGTDRARGTELTVVGATVNEICQMFNCRYDEGANAASLVFSDTAIKWTKRPTGSFPGHHSGPDEDIALYTSISSRFPHFSSNFAATSSVGMFTIQETIIQATEVVGSMERETIINAMVRIAELAVACGLSDLHGDNWGFRQSDSTFQTPVVFDYSGRTPSWDIGTCGMDIIESVGVCYFSPLSLARMQSLHIAAAERYDKLFC